MADYDPYSRVKKVSPAAAITGAVEPKTSDYDPYSRVKSATESSISPLNGSIQEPDLPAGEAKFAAAAPTTYAVARTVTDFLPYVNIAVWPSEREKFLGMSQGDQTKVLLHEAIATTLWVGLAGMNPGGGLAARGIDPGVIGKGYMVGRKWAATPNRMGDRIVSRFTNLARGKGFKPGGAKPAIPRVIPVEDALKQVAEAAPETPVPPFSYHDSLKKVLKRLNFRKGEIEDMIPLMESGSEFSGEQIIRGKFGKMKWGKGGGSKAFKEATEVLPAEMRPRMGIKQVFQDEFSPTMLRAKHNSVHFERMLRKEIIPGFPTKGKTKKISGNVVDSIFNSVKTNLYPEMRKAGFGEMSQGHMANIALNMLEGQWDISTKLLLGSGRFAPAAFQPWRVIWGAGEEMLGTRSNIHVPLGKYVGAGNRDYFNNILLMSRMFLDRGLHRSVKLKGSGEFKVTPAKHFTARVAQLAKQAMDAQDVLMSQARSLEAGAARARVGEVGGEGYLAAQTELVHRANQVGADLVGSVSGKDKEAAKVVPLVMDTVQKYYDHLLGMYYKERIPQVFEEAGLTTFGRDAVDILMSGPSGFNYEVDAIFASGTRNSPTEKIMRLQTLFTRAKTRLRFEGEAHPWFEVEGEGLGKTLANLDKELSYGKGMPEYLENYTPRMSSEARAAVSDWRRRLFPGDPAFTQARKSVEARGTVTLTEAIEGRTWQQARKLYVNSGVEKIIRYGEDLPATHREFLDAHISGVLGIPSTVDTKTAAFLQKTVGAAENLFGLPGLWDERRVMNLAMASNQLAYLAGIGFKPFSAGRNLFQTLINVPTDLGGVKDMGTLASGMRRVFTSPGDRAYLRSIGAISEFTADVSLRPKALPFGPIVKGVELPSLRRAFDVGLWMFKGSDTWNRYITGGAAMVKWDKALRKIDKDPARYTKSDVREFSRAIKLQGRDPWIRVEVEDLLHRKQFGEARAEMIRNVVLDTQYGYSALDAPPALRKWGAISRTGFIFQSWWMNYGNLIEKWVRTGESPGAKAERALTFALSQSIALTAMSELWGKSTALRSTFFGPFPAQISGKIIPPHWKPIIHSLGAVVALPNTEISSREFKKATGSAWMFIPGGLQLKAFARGYAEEEGEGLVKATGRFKFGEGFVSKPPAWLE